MRNLIETVREKIGRFVIYVLPLCVLSFAGASYLINSNVVYATNEVVREVVKEREAPVLDRIADCESGVRLTNGTAKPGSATHYDKHGQVLMRGNTNGSIDVGKYQINSVWFAQASALKLDVTDEADNKTMAEWIYENKGTGDWYASQSCWKR